MVSKNSPRVIPSAHVKGSKRGQEGVPLIEGSSPSPPNQPIRKEIVGAASVGDWLSLSSTSLGQ